MLTVEQLKKQPQQHYMDYKGRRMQVKDVVAYLESEQIRASEMIRRSKKDKEVTDIK